MALKQVIDVGGQGEAPRSRNIAGSGSAYAKNTNFDPTNTDFESTQLQALGEEIDGSLNTKANKSNLSNYILTGTKPSTALSSGTFFVDKDGALRVATDDIATTDDVGSGNSAVKSVGEVLSELNGNLTGLNTYVGSSHKFTGNASIGYVYSDNYQFPTVTGYTLVGLILMSGTYKTRAISCVNEGNNSYYCIWYQDEAEILTVWGIPIYKKLIS